VDEMMYKATTHEIEVAVEPFYLEEQSDPEDCRYVWGYQITVVNHSDKRVQLINRYWNITDGNGFIDEISGKGVVGEEPFIEPNSSYEYSSGCPLDTPSGIMFGTYQLQTDDGALFDVAIPAFSLDLPDQKRVLN
jgi:ApaG protein